MERDPWDDIAYVAGSRYRRKVLDALDRPRTPSEMTEKTGLIRPIVSRALKELEARGYVKCLDPDRRKGKAYGRTEAGNRLVAMKPASSTKR